MRSCPRQPRSVPAYLIYPQMKLLFVALVLFVVCGFAKPRGLPKLPKTLHSQRRDSNIPVLPTLYQLEKFHFAGPYGCITGYNGSALFLSQITFNNNFPDILYYGLCPPSSPIFFGARGFIKDLGTTPITDITANQAIYDTEFSGLAMEMKEGHSYLKHINESPIMGWVALHIDKIYPDGAMDITYGVLRYQVLQVTSESPHFAWNHSIH